MLNRWRGAEDVAPYDDSTKFIYTINEGRFEASFFDISPGVWVFYCMCRELAWRFDCNAERGRGAGDVAPYGEMRF